MIKWSLQKPISSSQIGIPNRSNSLVFIYFFIYFSFFHLSIINICQVFIRKCFTAFDNCIHLACWIGISKMKASICIYYKAVDALFMKFRINASISKEIYNEIDTGNSKQNETYKQKKKIKRKKGIWKQTNERTSKQPDRNQLQKWKGT